MKRFSILCCLVLLFNLLCPVAVATDDAGSVSTPTDIPCTHAETKYLSDGSTGHYLWCVECETTLSDAEPHGRWCEDAAGVCADCGYVGDDVNVMHYNTFLVSDDGSQHAYGCAECRTLSTDWVSHFVNCNAQGAETCAACGESLTTGEYHVSHCGEFVNQYDDTVHWQECSACDTVMGDKGEHYTNVGDPAGVCSYCGASYSCAHGSTTHYQGDANGCWKVCDTCGNKIEGTDQAHAKACINGDQDICHYCDTVYSGSNVEHAGPIIFTWDETLHWQICEHCGVRVDDVKAEHWVNCNAEEMKCFCGADYIGPNLNHMGNPEMDYDADNHWQKCDVCGLALDGTTENHYTADGTADGVCTGCGASYTVVPACTHAEGFLATAVEGGHRFECPDCHELDREGKVFSHIAYCTAQGICYVCDYIAEDINVTHGKVNFVPVEGGHDGFCEDCKQYTGYVFEHYTDEGDEAGVCSGCGASYTPVAECTHSSGNISHYETTATGHMAICEDCGEPAWEDYEDHYNNCQNETACAVCGIAWAGEAFHSGRYVSDGDQHYYYCDLCEAAVTEPEAHWATCVNKTECDMCGAETTNWMHVGEEVWTAIDGSSHSLICNECNAVMATENHRNCKDESKCELCDATVTMGFINHTEGDWICDENTHTKKCTVCELVISTGAHERLCDEENVCAVCEKPYNGSNVRHGSYIYKPVEGENKHQLVCGTCETYVLSESKHRVKCDDTTNTCAFCGAANVVTDQKSHYEEVFYEDKSDARVEYWGCPKCGTLTNQVEHEVECWAPDVCMNCGMTGVNGGNVMHDYVHGADSWEIDENFHWVVCDDCNQKIRYAEHWTYCDNGETCEICGASDVEFATVTHQPGQWEHDETSHWSVCACGMTIKEEHEKLCMDIGCDTCGAEYNGDNIRHTHWHTDYDENYHWSICKECGETYGRDVHTAVCTEPEICAGCFATDVTLTIDHYLDDNRYYNETSHWDYCGRCEDKVNESAHTWGEGTVSGDQVTYKCTGCEQTKTETVVATPTPTPEVTPTPAPESTPCAHSWAVTEEVAATCTEAGSTTSTCTLCGETMSVAVEAAGHSWYVTDRMDPTCEAEGYVYRACRNCDRTGGTTYDALGHSYGEVYTSQNNGTHAVTCATCGGKHAVECQLMSTDLGMMTCSACPVCGYAVYEMKETAIDEIEGLEDIVTAETVVTRVENVIIEAVEENAVAENAMLIVHETELEITVELPTEVEASVKKVVAVSLVKEGQNIQPSGKVKVSIPCVEKEMIGLALMLMGEDGQLIEIPYEIIDGMMVFETELVGVFLLVEAPEV